MALHASVCSSPVFLLQRKLQETLDEFEKIKLEIPAVVQPCMRPLINRVENAIMPGLTLITWSSMNFNKFLQDLTESVEELKIFTKKVRHEGSIPTGNGAHFFFVY